jgi:putative holliday junction resolvase
VADADTPRVPDRPGDPASAPDPGRGRRLGVDVGTVRIGVAVSDPDAILATPVETVPRDKRGGRHLRRLAALVDEYDAVEVIVGLPRTLADRQGASARDAIDVADRVAERIAPVPVRLTDERFTTLTAQRSLREAGVRARGQRSVIDQAAAVGILQNWLDQRRAALAAHDHVGNDARDEVADVRDG